MTSYGQKTRTRCFSRIYLKTSALHRHLSLPTPIPDSPYQKERHHAQMEERWSGKHYSPIARERWSKNWSAFQETVNAAGVLPIKLPPRSQNLNAHAERWVRSVKGEVLSRLILFGEGALRQLLKEDDIHDRQEPHHQAKGTELLMPFARKERWGTDPIRSRERLVG